MDQIIVGAFGLIGGIVGYIFTYLQGRKKGRAEAKKSELENVEGAVKIWREVAEEMASENAKIKDLYNSVYQQNIKLLAKNELLVKKVEALEKKLENIVK